MTRDRLHVVIASGGVAAVESLLALRELAGEKVEITLSRGRRAQVVAAYRAEQRPLGSIPGGRSSGGQPRGQLTRPMPML